MAGQQGLGTVLKPGTSANDGLASWYIEEDGSVRTNMDGRAGEERVLTPAANGTYESHASIGAARSAFIKNYQGAAGQAKLKSLLLSKGMLTKKEAAGSSWGIVGTNRLLHKYTYDSVYGAQTGVAPTGYSWDDWLKLPSASFGGSGTESQAGTSTREDVKLTDAPDAKTDINTFMVDSIGSGATKEEIAEYTAALSKLQKNSKEKTTATTDSKGRVIKATGIGDFVTEEEKTALQVNILKKRLKSTNVKTILESAKGSQIATDITTLKEWASVYGVSMSDESALGYVTAGFGTKDYINRQVEKIKAIAMQMYPTLKDHITGGGTVRDIAEQYSTRKAKKLGIAMGEPTQDKDVMNAVLKGTSVGDFDIEMQKKPEWRLTPEAHEIGTDFSNTILKSFGLMG
jgi:hypothetical protein